MDDLKKVKSFIFNDAVQKIISNINDHLMDFNILTITGMGSQEIKHSNILGWMMGDNEHNLEYQILDGFLKKIIEENKSNCFEEEKKIIDALQVYLYLAKNNRDIAVYREKDNIDLLLVDSNNHVVIVIENKVEASERTDGEDGGQLKKYEEIIEKKYNSSLYETYYIFLTKNLEEPQNGQHYWLRANYKMISDTIEDMLKTKELMPKAKIILESYVDLLKRSGIVEDDTLRELCRQIWENEEYASAFEVIMNNRPNKVNEIKEILSQYEPKEYITGSAHSFFLKFHNQSCLTYIIQYSSEKKNVQFSIVSEEDMARKAIDRSNKIQIDGYDYELADRGLRRKKPKYVGLSSGYRLICSEDNLDMLSNWINKAKEADENFIDNLK